MSTTTIMVLILWIYSCFLRCFLIHVRCQCPRHLYHTHIISEVGTRKNCTSYPLYQGCYVVVVVMWFLRPFYSLELFLTNDQIILQISQWWLLGKSTIPLLMQNAYLLALHFEEEQVFLQTFEYFHLCIPSWEKIVSTPPHSLDEFHNK